jgi:hypothetical protein
MILFKKFKLLFKERSIMRIFTIFVLIWVLVSCGNFTKKSNTDKLNQDISNSISIKNKEEFEQIQVLDNQKTNVDLVKDNSFDNETELVEQVHNIDYLIINDESVIIPSFEIEIELSKTAEEKLFNDNESVIIAAYFTSQLNDIEKISKKYEDRLIRNDIRILTYTIELTDTRLARFENLEFPKDLYDLLDNKDIHVLINVFSGRRSTNINLLYCAILSGPISKVREQKFILNGGLIEERIETKNISFR